MNKAVITGPTGAVGTALIQYLIDKNIEVLALVRPQSERIDQIPKHPLVRIVACELSKLSELSIPDFQYSTFYHLGWEGTFGDCRNDMYLQNKNVKYTLDAVQLAKRMESTTFIFVGSQAEYGRVEEKLSPSTPTFPENGYGMAKLCAGFMSRRLCEMMQMKHCWVRILSIYGPNDGPNTLINSSIRKLAAGEETIYTPCEQQWDYLYSKDAAKALYLIAEKGRAGSVYNLGSGIAFPLKYYLETMRNIINPTMALGIGKLPYNDKQVMYLCADIQNLQQDTGFTADYSFDEGIKETILWYKQK